MQHTNFKVIHAPNSLKNLDRRVKVFLGGAIDNGMAPNWQSEIIELLSPYPVIALNPRRKNWNPKADSKVIRRQIRWELDAQHYSDINLYVFPEKTIAPITLLELGLFIEKRCLVYCSKNYWRYLNVSETCKYYGVNVFTNWFVFKNAILNEVNYFLGQRNFINLGDVY